MRTLLIAVALLAVAVFPAAATPLQIYGVWHAGNDYCIWGSERDTAEFDSKNHWIIDSGDGVPSVNLVILSFIEPLKLLHRTTDTATLDGVPRGMTPEIVQYFKSRGIRVMISIGGITYVDEWEAALAEDATLLGLNAAEVATRLGVGIEIDYEGSADASVEALQAFIDAYRSVHPYDASGDDHTARLTVDLAAGDRWLIALCAKSTREWLDPANPVLDYANAMVPARQPSASGAIENWQEHLDGKPQYDPPIPPLAPCKFTAGLYLTGRSIEPECVDFMSSVHYATRDFVLNAPPNGAGTTPGLLGYMFWAAECQGTRSECTIPPNACTGGLGEGSQYFGIPIPMPPLRQDAPTVDVAPPMVDGFAFEFARPNPSARSTAFTFVLPVASRVDLRVFDVQGRERAQPVASGFPAGRHTLRFDGLDRDGRALPAGAYYARIHATDAAGRGLTRTMRFTILR